MHDPLNDIFDQISRENHRIQFFEQQFQELFGFSLEPARIFFRKQGFNPGRSLREFYQSAIKLPVDLFTNEELDTIVPFLEKIQTLL